MRRRDVLGLLTFAGLATATGHLLSVYAPWLDYGREIEQTWDVAYRTGTHRSARFLELVRCATLAASGHNAQPWRFAMRSGVIRMYADYSRRLPVVDPHDRELWISLGCALENLLITARVEGYEGHVTYPAPGADFINIRLGPAVARSTPLFDAIRFRQNTRRPYDGRPIAAAILRELERLPVQTGIHLQILTVDGEREAVLEFIREGDAHQFADQAFVDELLAWIRFNKPEAVETRDGLYARCTGNPDVPRWLGSLVVRTSGAMRQSRTDEAAIRSSAGFIAIISDQNDIASWIDTGRTYERLALAMTTRNIRSAFLNQPIEVPELRSQFQRHLNIGTAWPQLLLRFGYADLMPHSLRRPIEEMLV